MSDVDLKKTLKTIKSPGWKFWVGKTAKEQAFEKLAKYASSGNKDALEELKHLLENPILPMNIPTVGVIAGLGIDPNLTAPVFIEQINSVFENSIDDEVIDLLKQLTMVKNHEEGVINSVLDNTFFDATEKLGNSIGSTPIYPDMYAMKYRRYVVRFINNCDTDTIKIALEGLCRCLTKTTKARLTSAIASAIDEILENNTDIPTEEIAGIAANLKEAKTNLSGDKAVERMIGPAVQAAASLIGDADNMDKQQIWDAVAQGRDMILAPIERLLKRIEEQGGK